METTAIDRKDYHAWVWWTAAGWAIGALARHFLFMAIIKHFPAFLTGGPTPWSRSGWWALIGGFGGLVCGAIAGYGQQKAVRRVAGKAEVNQYMAVTAIATCVGWALAYGVQRAAESMLRSSAFYRSVIRLAPMILSMPMTQLILAAGLALGVLMAGCAQWRILKTYPHSIRFSGWLRAVVLGALGAGAIIEAMYVVMPILFNFLFVDVNLMIETPLISFKTINSILNLTVLPGSFGLAGTLIGRLTGRALLGGFNRNSEEHLENNTTIGT